MAIDQKTIQVAQQLRQAGQSLRDIAEELLGRRTQESTLRYHLSKLSDQEEGVPEGAKILVFDIETAPCMSYHWRRWKENIGQEQAITESYMLTWAAKWLGDDAVISDALYNYDMYNQDPENDYHVVQSLSKLLDEADMVVAHNGRRFDIPVLRTRMVYHGLDPFNPTRVIDTLQIAKKEFKFPSNALNSIAQYFGLGEKLKHDGFSLWRGVMENDPDAWDTMIRYNEQDVLLLEDVYLKLRPWDTRHPNVALYGDLTIERCPCCGSSDLEKTEVYDTTNVSKFPVYKCNSCGKPSSSRKSVLDKDERKAVLRNTR